jgi:hypothetical protein
MQAEPKHKPMHFSRSAHPRTIVGLLALLGMLVFATGALVHAVDGGHRTAWLLPNLLPGLSDPRHLFGSAGRWFPNFAQAFAFSVWTALLPIRSRAIICCTLWAVIDIALELSPAPPSGADALGVLATLAGCTAAWWILSYSHNSPARPAAP